MCTHSAPLEARGFHPHARCTGLFARIFKQNAGALHWAAGAFGMTEEQR